MSIKCYVLGGPRYKALGVSRGSPRLHFIIMFMLMFVCCCCCDRNKVQFKKKSSIQYIHMLLTYLCLFARSEHRPSTKERHCFLSVAIFSISFQVYPISFVSFSVSLCQVFRGLPLVLFPGGFHVMA